VVDEPIQKNLHVVEKPMASLNVLIEDENDVVLTDYVKTIGLAMRGIKVFISEK
jgi:hypothetical protein